MDFFFSPPYWSVIIYQSFIFKLAAKSVSMGYIVILPWSSPFRSLWQHWLQKFKSSWVYRSAISVYHSLCYPSSHRYFTSRLDLKVYGENRDIILNIVMQLWFCKMWGKCLSHIETDGLVLSNANVFNGVMLCKLKLWKNFFFFWVSQIK